MGQDLWSDGERVTEQENAELVKPFVENQIKSALFKMEKTKQLGRMAFL
jgi:hypothetical protein